MGKSGPPYKLPDDAQWIVVLKPPHVKQQNGQIDFAPLEYWLRAIFSDQRAAKFIYVIRNVLPDSAVIVELPGPDELPIHPAAYGQHSLRFGLKRRPWFTHETGFTTILPYKFEQMGHPEDTRKFLPMISGNCEDEWLKFDLTIPYPIPQRLEFSQIPQEVRSYCHRIPDVPHLPPNPMEIERYPTPPAQEPQRVQNFHQASQSTKEHPLFIPEDDSKPKIKNLDPYQEEESLSSFLRDPSSAIDTSGDLKSEPQLESVAQRFTFDANGTDRESNVSSFRGDRSGRLTAANDEPENSLSVKQEFANQDDTESQRMHDLLQTVNRSQSPSVDDRLSVKRELENQDGATVREMYELLATVNRGQSTRGDRPGSGAIKRYPDVRDAEPGEYNLSRNAGSGPQVPRYPAPSRNRDRDGGREREREPDDRPWNREREPPRIQGSDRKRSFAHPDGRDDRGFSGNRREYPDKRSRANYQ